MNRVEHTSVDLRFPLRTIRVATTDVDKINAVGMHPRIFGEPDGRPASRSSDKTSANRLFLQCTACDVDRAATAAAAAARGACDRGGTVRPN